MNEKLNEEPESFIVQNVTLGPHYISDIRLQFDPLAVVDLTWEDPKVIKASKDLRNSLRLGLLKKISPDQWEKVLDQQATKEKKELLKQSNAANLSTIEVDGKQIEAETINPSRTVKAENSVSTAGYANDSISYATALDIAQTQAELRGEELSVEDFADQVQKNPELVQNLLASNKYMEEMSITSGDARKGKAYVASSPEGMNGTTVTEMQMVNYNRDRRSSIDYDVNNTDYNEDAIADAIDLDQDFDDSEKGSVRRV